jgi:hypothetical protein
MKLLIKQFVRISYHFNPFKSKYSQRLPFLDIVLMHFKVIFFQAIALHVENTEI